MTEPKRKPGASCANCVRAEPFAVIPGLGPQDAEAIRKCSHFGLAVGAGYYCPKWRLRRE